MRAPDRSVRISIKYEIFYIKIFSLETAEFSTRRSILFNEEDRYDFNVFTGKKPSEVKTEQSKDRHVCHDLAISSH